MFYTKQGFPEEDELVITIVKKVNPHSAFVKLEEYDKEAMLHVSEISSSWIKNIRDYVQEGALLVLKVVGLHEEKGHIDVSLKRVSEGERKRKLLEWKIEKKMEKLLELLAKKKEKTLEQAYDAIGNIILDNFGSLYNFYDAIKTEGESILKEFEADPTWKKEFFKSVKDQIKASRVKMHKIVEIITYSPDGIDRIKRILKDVKTLDSGAEVEVKYLSAPKYEISLTIENYKAGEYLFSEISELIESKAKKEGIEFKVVK